MDKLAPKWFWLCFYAFTVGLGAFHTGWALFGSTQIFPVLEAKFGWTHEEALMNHSLIGSSSIAGVMVGSLFGGGIIDKGRRRAILMISVLIYIGAGITLILTVPTIIIGRFICGIAAGILTMCNAKSIVETVPVKYNGVFGALTNILICYGGLIALSLGLALPDEEHYKDDEMWRLTYGFPMVLSTIQILLLLLVFKWEPIDFMINRGEDEKALQFIAKVYVPAKGNTLDNQQVFKNYVNERRAELKAA